MKNIVLVLAMALLVGCGTVGIDTPMGKTAACLKQADDVGEAVYVDLEKGELVPLSDEERAEIIQNARNECWWNKGDSKN